MQIWIQRPKITLQRSSGYRIQNLCWTVLSINNITIDDPKQITNHFNDYFVNIASKLVSNLSQLPHNFQIYLPSPILNALYFHATTLFEIKKLVNSILPKNSFGTDEVPSSILKTTPDNVLFALTHVFNLSLIDGAFISGFKTAKVLQIYKKSCRQRVRVVKARDEHGLELKSDWSWSRFLLICNGVGLESESIF